MHWPQKVGSAQEVIELLITKYVHIFIYQLKTNLVDIWGQLFYFGFQNWYGFVKFENMVDKFIKMSDDYNI